ncbi:type II toxin-antitoxin system RelE/ParE family toxin [Sphingobium sp. CR2-8]|uniref:type II toxin-antitoxin system RelE/ParE family toxin n=1 Tax=Sphingobium sp. CR2-8 TaxID=1306534 RepID=UPI002DB8C9F7|nr:type II toxin-antitoxin system RelE/ParE family toxin [Sphingobium sp. CR2-8]MEC3910210.1 type II toxin-antitoxin system RelE/ParE family toxin [Sphingobium sp. CR2-8]
MIVRWTPEARQDRSDIWDYLVALDPCAAMRMDEQFSVAVARLADFPMLGHEGAMPGTRELTPHPGYRLVYEVDGDTVWILTLVHAMRLWPPVR